MREDTKSAEDIHQSKTYNDTEIKRDCNNSKMSSISDNLKCSNASAEEIIQNPGALISAFSAGTLCASSNLGGWPSVYYIYGSIGLVQCFCVQQFLYESPKIHPKITEEEKSYILHYQEADLNKKRPPTPWKDITRSIPVYAMTYAMFGAYWAATHLLTIHPIFLTTMLHFSLEENGFLVSLTFVIQIILSFGTSFVSNWLNRHNLVGVDKLRKGINFLASLGYSLGLLGIYFAGCDATMSKWLGIIGMSFSGFVFGGCMIVPLDMSPTFAGTLMGLTTTAASSAAFILPLIYGKLIQEEQSLAQWNKIYFISIAVIMSGGIIFCLFGSAEIQPWNYTSEDQRRNNCSKDGKKKDKIDETVTAIEAVVHL
ncbi:putative inorganic phosphate cotransporter like protein [Argiope bruennichi]|uniref:Putative inorganic phosphate cotransporter like protein n=1 Tax=Argiope bruennichi TaxID=94029 RepID=A0A8T0FBJ4_ARGBR|nr:putative inorganic phosphate cotransporter like protein [Argiope bruennichi]